MDGRLRLHVYVAGTAVLAGGLVLWALPRVALGPVLAVVLSVMVAERFATVMRDKVAVSLTNVVALVAIVVGGPALAVIGALGAIPIYAHRSKSPMRVTSTVFNSSMLPVSAAAGGFTYEVLLVQFGGIFPDWRSLLAITAAAATYSVVNLGLVAGVVSLATGDSFFDAFRTIGQSLA
ncbi:MAG: hypothetical protein ACQEUI_08070, partial [Actinomycetota bacterium]